ncbi:MAG: hypothetical protein U9N81_13575 [Bacillota bacterium]|nr:hypothetical protein [Bacillota bacterium]
MVGSAVTALAFSAYENKAYGYILLIVAISVFAYLVVKHDKTINEANRTRNMAEINESCILRMEGQWAGNSDDGAAYVNRNHSYTHDLDIFGHASLFQWINISNTYCGREALRTLLENPDKRIHSINQRQVAVKELVPKLAFCQGLQCEGMGNHGLKQNPEDILGYAEKKSKLFSRRWLKVIFFGLPGLTILSFIIWYFSGSISLSIPFLFLGLQVMILVLGYRQMNDALATINSYKTKVSVYRRLLELIEKEQFHDTYLSALQSTLFQGNKSASQQIKKLDSIVGAVALRHNPYVHFFVIPE